MPQRFSKVLIVAHDAARQESLCEAVGREGLAVMACGAAADALTAARLESFPVIIVDLGQTGLEAAQLEQFHRLEHPPRVIIHTAAPSFDSAKQAVNLGAFAYVEQSAGFGELLRHVHRACREQAGRWTADLETAVRRRTDDLIRSNRELADVTSVAAHDLRGPLLTISGYAQLLQEEYEPRLDDGARQYIAQILDGVGRITRLLEGLLSYCRIGRSDEPFQEVDLQTVLPAVLLSLKSEIVQSGVRIESGPMPTVFGARSQLTQLLYGLIHNAITFRRQRDAWIRLAASKQDDFWQFTVADNGIGMQAEHFEQIFQVFRRLHGREYPGIGVGLAICEKIVELHGGKIWLTSEPHHGTTFYFTLPDANGQP